ncbi:hypothetical protein ACHAQA_005044 [Verticillium albo-atrum]
MHRPQLLTPAELGKIQSRAEENEKLAACWDRENVGMLLFEYCVRRRSYTTYPMLFLSVMPRGIPVKPRHGYMYRPNRRFTFRGAAPGTQPREDSYGTSTAYELPVEGMKAKIEEVLADLNKEFTTLCVCTARGKRLMVELQEINFTLPKRIVLVDLVKVLEFQAVPDVIDKVLAGEEGFAARANNGELWTGPGHGAGCLLDSVLLSLVGPLAKNYTGDWKKIEREAVAASRLWGASGIKVVEEMKKMKRKSSRQAKEG